MNIDGKIIANNIRAERNRIDITQSEVADKLGISTKTYISYEDNAESIKATVLYKLSQILNCNLNAFFVLDKSTKCEEKIRKEI